MAFHDPFVIPHCPSNFLWSVSHIWKEVDATVNYPLVCDSAWLSGHKGNVNNVHFNFFEIVTHAYGTHFLIRPQSFRSKLSYVSAAVGLDFRSKESRDIVIGHYGFSKTMTINSLMAQAIQSSNEVGLNLKNKKIENKI